MLQVVIIWLFLLQSITFEGKMSASSGYIRFYSEAPLENIEAINNKVKAAIDLSTGDLLFIVPIEEFVFEKNLMQKHFNQQYMESDKFPDARFVGKIKDLNSITSEGLTEHEVTGELTIHGVTKTINEKAYLQLHDEYLSGSSKFKVRTADFDIKIPRILIMNIAEEIEVTVEVKFKPVK
jgi:polyisoprenoid-binding protein YceI